MDIEKCGEGGRATLFDDSDFPSDDRSLFSDGSSPLARLQDEVTWRRPQELCDCPALFPANINEGHAKQGLLGDCWFLCACTFLLKNKHLMNKVCPPDQPLWGDCMYQGSFQFHIWQKGHWTMVTIDDRLPCIGSTLCFSRCHSPTAFWVALLEKAYAKLHGSYESLWAGQVSEALVDLSGGLAERWSLEKGGADEAEGSGQDSDRLQRRRLDLRLLRPVRDLCALSCSTHSSPGGGVDLEQYHAMSVTEWLDVETVSGARLTLLRIRNPWGRRGTWLKGEACWSSVDPALRVELQGRLEAGEFWVDEAEFLSQFDDVTVGYPITEDGHLKSIFTGSVLSHSRQLPGRWTRGVTAGGCRNCTSYATNPKFWLKVSERGEVLVSLHQQGECRGNPERYAHNPLEGGPNTQPQHYQAIALHMWKVEKKRFNLARVLNKAPSASTHCHAYEREVVLHGHLQPGHYLLIPSTFLAGAQSSFLLRAFSSGPVSLSAMRSPAGPPLPLLADSEWDHCDFQGGWVAGISAGGSRNSPSHRKNPRFLLSLGGHADAPPSPGVDVRVSLRQNRPDADLYAIGFHVYKVPEGVSVMALPLDEEPVASCVPHCYTQDVSLACCLPAGTYAIIPSTYQPELPGSFTVSVARRIYRKVMKSQELLGNTIQEVSHISVMQS
ncbi:calpain-10 isoform X1 [Gadus macrocephalus]|uniref:calpain-10 isoform X1 n=1 Tax=Gadus macrocephalus TaxID=80720 RepID=UPI0028CB5137|nr:calpain-10 isoform X1 [Gadus macrocephalus]XP_059915379.1 calpain-10 isoform X1 [Gadus macrocephalus]XP_059915380.1 calpain-10 isoform X1 [Gadus macrocephalus]